MLTGKESSPCITIPANRVRMPYQHRTHPNIIRQGPRHLPDNKQSSKLHQQARYGLSDIIIRTVQRQHKKLQTISNSGSEKTTSTFGAGPESEMSNGKKSSTCITHPANCVSRPYLHIAHLNVF
jgi:hypothetical protein